MQVRRGACSFLLILIAMILFSTAAYAAGESPNNTFNESLLVSSSLSPVPTSYTTEKIPLSTINETSTESIAVETPSLPNLTSQENATLIISPAVSSSGSDIVSTFSSDGTQIEARRIGPGLPPKTYVANANRAMALDILSSSSLNTAAVPALFWSYGCSATSATMFFGYYDRNGYPNIYTGPTNSGVFPLTNTIWGTSSEGQGECPLTATHSGIDGRVTKGHVDDYYSVISSSVDPYYGFWTPHSPQDSIADFMGTSQYQAWGNYDGSTTFFFIPNGAPLSDYSGSESPPDPMRDGTHGMRLFAESRGYNVSADYNQYIYGYNGNTQGFTYAQYKSEIDAGNPVLIHLAGHTILGVGYSGTDSVVIYDTWSYLPQTMTWGGSYSGRAQQGVSVFHLSPVSNFTSDQRFGNGPLTVQFNDTSGGNPVSWSWNFGDGDSTNSTVQNPVHTFTATGTYPVSLTVTNTWGDRNTTTRSGYIQVLDGAAPTVTGIHPSSGVNSSLLVITNLVGSNFYGSPTVVLNRTGSSDILATNVTVIDPTKITCTIQITGVIAGLYNVTVINPDGKQGALNNGFNIVFIAPGISGVYRPGAGFYLKMTNDNVWNPSSDKYYAWDNYPTDLPIAGDWNNDGISEMGVYRPGAGFYLKMTNDNVWNPSSDRYYAWDNAPNDLPIGGQYFL